MNQKNIFIIIGVVIVLALIAWGVSAMNNDDTVTIETEPISTASPAATSTLPGTTTATVAPSTTTKPESGILTVKYDGSAFSPSTLTIKKGQTVTFMNNSSRSMWVASNPHPLHTDFSAFDARKGFAKGTSYTFTFNQAGTFDYHDHLNDNATGTIVVQ